MANNSGKFFGKGKKALSEIEQYEESIRKNPEDDRAYVRLAELYARAGRETKAVETYEKVAIIFEKKGFIERAKAVLKQALLLSPEHGKINVLLGDYYKQGGLVKDAAMSYNTAVSYYVKTGNKIAAINILRKMLELYPGNLNLSVKLANMLISEGMNHDAEKILVPLAESLKNSDKVNEYVSVLKLLYTATDSDAEIGKTLVNFYLKKGSYSNALIVLQKLVVDNPDTIEFLEKLAFVFEKLGETSKLIAIYKQIAVVYKKHKNYAERDEMYRKILALDPNDREALLILNENAKLRDIISDKINVSTGDIKREDGGRDDLVIDVDAAKSHHKSPLRSSIKEARAFLNYKLFDKAVDKIKSSEGWETSDDAYDVLIEAYIESGKVAEAGELLVSLIDLKVSEGKIDEARDLLGDAEDMLGAEDSRITARKAQIALKESESANPETGGEGELFSGIPNLSDALEEAEKPEKPVERPEESVKKPADFFEQPAESLETFKKVEDVSDLVTDESAEPPQDRLDELEFYITIEDFVSATQLLKELVESFPNSKFLKEIKAAIPETNGE
ncbi:tetratricopeptide repeat protein [bacterium]|nr:tetratricopeptide repeat protein [bacterium]